MFLMELKSVKNAGCSNSESISLEQVVCLESFVNSIVVLFKNPVGTAQSMVFSHKGWPLYHLHEQLLFDTSPQNKGP